MLEYLDESLGYEKQKKFFGFHTITTNYRNRLQSSQ